MHHDGRTSSEAFFLFFFFFFWLGNMLGRLNLERRLSFEWVWASILDSHCVAFLVLENSFLVCVFWRGWPSNKRQTYICTVRIKFNKFKDHALERSILLYYLFFNVDVVIYARAVLIGIHLMGRRLLRLSGTLSHFCRGAQSSCQSHVRRGTFSH